MANFSLTYRFFDTTKSIKHWWLIQMHFLNGLSTLRLLLSNTLTSYKRVFSLPTRSFSEYNPIRMIICSLHKLDTRKILPMTHCLKSRKLSYLSLPLHYLRRASSGWLFFGWPKGASRAKRGKNMTKSKENFFNCVSLPAGWLEAMAKVAETFLSSNIYLFE